MRALVGMARGEEAYGGAGEASALGRYVLGGDAGGQCCPSGTGQTVVEIVCVSVRDSPESDGPVCGVGIGCGEYVGTLFPAYLQQLYLSGLDGEIELPLFVLHQQHPGRFARGAPGCDLGLGCEPVVLHAASDICRGGA